MSKLQQYISIQNQIKDLQDQLEVMDNSPDLKKEIEFKNKLTALQEEYGKSAKDTLNILSQIDPSVLSGGSTSARRPRPLRVYKNPHTGEVVKTKGGNHKTLKEWRDKYGKEAVDSWKE
jgi:hypothetical protein